MTKLVAGANIIHDGVAVELLFLASEDGDEQLWWCRRTFVEDPETEMRTFRRGTPYRAIHGTLSFSM